MTQRTYAFVIGFLLMLSCSFQASAQAPAPTKITFTILNTCSSGDSYSFFVNGTSIGTVGGNTSGGCACDASLQTFTVNNTALLAGAWSSSGSNTVRVRKNGTATYFAWVSAKLDFATGSSSAYYDYNGGDATETNLCNAQYNAASFDQVLTPAATVVFYKDTDGDGFGDPNTIVTSNTNNSLAPVSPPAGYVTNSADCEDSDPTIPSQTPCQAKPFNKTAPGLGFTQELVASLPDGQPTSGYGFDSHGNPYTYSFNGNLYKIDLSTTNPGPSGVGTIHPLVSLGPIKYRTGTRTGQSIGTIYNFTQYPDGTVYANSDLGVVQVNLETATATSEPLPGSAWGIVVDPQLNAHGHHNIITAGGRVVDPVDHRDLGSCGISGDGIAIDATGNFIFAASGFKIYKRTSASGVDLPVFTAIGNYGGSPDGMAFGVVGTDQVVVSNDGGAKTVTMWKFPNNDFTKTPTPTIIASQPTNGEYGDQANVGPDGYFYITYWYGTRFPDGSTNGNTSVVRFGPAGRFLPPTHSDNISLTPAADTKTIGTNLVLTATLVSTDLSTNQTVPVVGTSVTFKVVGGPDNGQTFTGNTDASGQVTFTLVNQNGVGADVVHAQYVDGNGNTQTSNNAVITFERPACTAPAFTSSPGNQTANTSSSSCDNTVTYSSTETVTGTPALAITYAFTGATTGNGNGNGSGSLFNKGITTVTLTATNSCGSATSVFTVTVTDNIKPVLTPAADQDVNLNGSCSVTIPDVRGTATDNCSTVTITQSPAIGTVVSATHNQQISITVTATDGSNNTAVSTVMLTAKDVTAPTVVGQNVTVQLNASGSATILSAASALSDIFFENFNQEAPGLKTTLANWNFTQGGMTVDVGDYITGNSATEIDLAGNNNARIVSKKSFYLVPGQYKVSFDNKLNNNPAGGNSVELRIGSLLDQTFASQLTATTESTTFTVVTPTLVNLDFEQLGANDAAGSFISNIRLSRVVNPNYTVFVSATDCSGIDAIAVSKSTFDCSNTGNNNVTLSVTDAAGNVTQQNVVVTVQDNIKPVLTPAANQNVNLDGSCAATIPDVRGTATDNCSATITQSPAIGAVVASSHNGTIGVTVTATDAAGNTDVKVVMLTAKDVTAPAVTCRSNISVNNDANRCGAVITYALPVATDNCSGGAFNYFNAGEPNNAGSEDHLQFYNNGTWNDLNGNNGGLSYIIEINSIYTNSITNYTRLGEYGGHTYYKSNFNATWFNARANALALGIGADLASINTLGESTFLAPYGGSVWVGGFQDHSDPDYAEPGNASQNWGGWKWVDGTKLGAGQIAINRTSGYASGTLFPIGTTTVTHTASDQAGNTSSCSFTVTVTDNQKPVITTNGNKSVPAEAGRCDAAVVVSATASDNCTVGAPAGVRSDGQSLTAPYPVGTTTITWNVADVNGNAATPVTQTVVVTDTQKPVISGMPSNIVKNAVLNNCLALVTWAAPTASDNCGIASFVSSDADINSGTGFTLLPVGVTTITYTATDIHGNVTTASFTVTVQDVQPPVITGCPGSIAVTTAPGTCGKQVFWNQPTASDNCLGVTLTGDHVSGDIFAVGTTRVTYTATDAAGLVTVCGFDVVVTDNEAPVVSNCPANITVQTGVGNTTCSQTATWTAPTATDNCGGVSVSSSHQPGATFALGTTTVTYTFRDTHNNISTCSFTVTVVDNTAPVPNVANLTVVRAECSASVTAPTATDACNGIITATTSDPVSYSAQGTYTIHWTYNDGNGNTSSQNQTVIIKDVTPPVIACPFNIVTNSTVGQCGANVTYNQPSATDNCGSGVLPITLAGYTYKGTFNGHTYFVSNTQANPETAHAAAIGLGGHLATITDAAENTLVSGFLPGQPMWIGFTDRDTEGTYKWITNEPVTYTNWAPGEPNDCCSGNPHEEDWAVINWGGSSQWNDWYYNQPAYYVVEFEGGSIPTTLVSGPASGGFFPVGTTTVTYNATDAGGNTATCSFTVTVNDVEPPRIACPSNINAIATSAAGAVVNYTAPVGTDNCGGTTTVRTAGPASGSTFPIGTTTITYKATDASGLSSQCSFTVTVVGVPPSVVCPANIVVSNTTGACGTDVNFTATETTAIPASTITYSQQPGSFFPVGTTTVTATATNAVGTSTCTFTITVNDVEAPILAGVPSAVTVECTSVPGAAVVTASDNCPGLGAVQYNEVKTNGNCAGNYTLTRTWTVTDAHNNSTSATQIITVQDTKAPVISTVASDKTVECDGQGNVAQLQAWLDSHGGATATDACSGVTWSNNFTALSDDCGNTGSATVTFTAKDACGNTSTTSATFTIVDTTPPSITPAANSTVECDGHGNVAELQAWLANHGGATASDVCSGVTWSNNFTALSDDCGNTGAATVIFTATDACGNKSTTTATFRIEDTTAPTITAASNSTVECDGHGNTDQLNAWLANHGGATASDICSGGVTWTNNFTALSDGCGQTGSASVTFTATDDCGNASSTTATFAIEDHTAPVISCPASVTLNCQDSTNPSATGTATATDICSGATISYSDVSTQNSSVNDRAHYNYTITRTWKAVDACGNASNCTQVITVQDITAPTALCKPVTITLVNGAASITPASVDNNSNDICSPVTLSVSPSTFNCGNIGLNTVTLTVKDVSGNTSTCQAVVKVVGEIPTCNVTSVPSSNTYTGGVPTNLFLGYGAQSTTLQLDVPATGAPYSFSWTGNGTLSSTSVQSPLFAPTAAGTYTFTVFITNKYGCTTTCRISICVTDIRVKNSNGTWDGKKVYVCHVPPGNPANSNTLEISVNAVPAHIGPSGHATDRLGRCDVPACGTTVYARGTTPPPAEKIASIMAYPNPTTGVFELLLQNYNKGKVEIQVIDNYGKLITKQTLNVMNASENVMMDVTKHASGVYHVRVVSEDGIKTLRVVVAR